MIANEKTYAPRLGVGCPNLRQYRFLGMTRFGPLPRLIALNGVRLDMGTMTGAKTVLPLKSGERIVLFYWSISEDPRLRNLMRVDRDGNSVWQADLPGSSKHDCFIKLNRQGSGFLAETFCGHLLHLDADGHPFERELSSA